MFEGRRTAREQSLEAAVAPLLRAGETVRHSFAGQSSARWVFAIPLGAVVHWWGGLGLLVVAVVACIAVDLLLLVRYYWVVLTDRRALVLVWRHPWSKTSAEMLEGPRRAGSPTDVSTKPGQYVKLEVGDRTVGVHVPGSYQDRAAAAVAEAAVRRETCALAPGGGGGGVRWKVTHLFEGDP